MDHWTPREQKLARQIGIPRNADRTWWWRAGHVLNSDERAKLEAFCDRLGAYFERRDRLRVV